METENFVGYDLQREYLSTLRATRVASTVLLMLCGAWCWKEYLFVEGGTQVLENMVQGGTDSLPVLTQFVIKYGMALTGIAALGVFSALLFNWSIARSVSPVIHATTLGATLSVLVGHLLHFAMASPLQTMLTRFPG